MFVSSGEAGILHADLDSFYASVEQRDDPGREVIADLVDDVQRGDQRVGEGAVGLGVATVSRRVHAIRLMRTNSSAKGT